MKSPPAHEESKLLVLWTRHLSLNGILSESEECGSLLKRISFEQKAFYPFLLVEDSPPSARNYYMFN